jgi:hypothetical protein
MPHEGSVDLVSGRQIQIPLKHAVSELTERDTRAIEASVVSSAPPVAETEDGVTLETRPTLIDPLGAWGLELPDPRSRDQGLKAGSRRV